MIIFFCLLRKVDCLFAREKVFVMFLREIDFEP